MSADAQLHYFCKPADLPPPLPPVAFLPVQEFLADEPACLQFWDLVVNQFRTRSKFLSIWPSVRFVVVHRDANNAADGFLLVTAPVNWQIDYVVVNESSRGQGIAAAMVKETVRQAFRRNVPYVMLTSNASLRGLYESCGFRVIESGSLSPLRGEG